jgi:hypothetical protein
VEEREQEPLWCLQANIVAERQFGPDGLDKSAETRHFRGGAKVYVIDWFAGQCHDVVVIGHHRKSLQLAKMVLPVSCIQNLRVKLVYSPTVIGMLKEHHSRRQPDPWLTKEEAEEMLRTIPVWQAQ